MIDFDDDGTPADANLNSLLDHAEQIGLIAAGLDRIVQPSIAGIGARVAAKTAREACYCLRDQASWHLDQIDKLLDQREAGTGKCPCPLDIPTFREAALIIRQALKRAAARACEPDLNHAEVWAKASAYVERHANTLQDLCYEALNAVYYREDGTVVAIVSPHGLGMVVEIATITPVVGEARAA